MLPQKGPVHVLCENADQLEIVGDINEVEGGLEEGLGRVGVKADAAVMPQVRVGRGPSYVGGGLEACWYS